MLKNWLGMLCLALAPATQSSGVQPRSAIRVHDAVTGCMGAANVHDYEWTREPGGYRLGDAFLTDERIETLRARALAARAQPDDLLAQVGVTPATIRSHRLEILDSAWPEAIRPPDGTPFDLPADLEHLVSYDSIAPHALTMLIRPAFSTTRYELRIELPGNPPITIESEGGRAWKLPWSVTVGASHSTANDLELSRAIQPLLLPKGPNARLLDGSQYWTRDFWRDETFWSGVVGRPLDDALSRRACTPLEGYADTVARFAIKNAMSGSVGMQPTSFYFELEARETPTMVERIRWWNPIVEGKPTATWIDFLSVYELASACIQNHPWLGDWKRAGVDRTLELHAVGSTGFAETMLETFVFPPWEYSRFVGHPEFEILLRRKGKACGTVWLSSAESSAMIESARADERDAGHWFDGLEIRFHPTKPSYGVVDGSGKFELKAIGR